MDDLGVFVEVWRTWDRYPGADREAGLFEDAVKALAARLGGVRPSALREFLMARRRAGDGYLAALDAAYDAWG